MSTVNQLNIAEFKNVTYCYNAGTNDEIRAVKGVSFCVRQGDFVALVGHNGSGKSTVAKLLNGLLKPKTGQVLVNGKCTKDKANTFEIRSTLSVVFQNPDNQMVATIIQDDVAFGPENLGLSHKKIKQRVDWALEVVGMSEYKEGTATRLSGGQKQRVAIAGVLALKPSVIVLDEATSMLDPRGRQEVLDVVRRLNKEEGMTVIMITHFMEEAAEYANRIIVLDKGEVLLDGGKEIFNQREKIENAGLQLPFGARIASELKKSGLNLKNGILTLDDLVKNL
ncbi:MAG: energy-coupling factor transporter ATPase [Firmicutes bacterium]|nr:energy-coupling factor transporter ATPase [Bacillota bacterium]